MKKQVAKFYNAFAVFYPLVDYFLRPQKHLLAKLINQFPAGKLLEVGVGNGSHLADFKNHQITGIDISSAMLAKAQRLNKGVELLEMDGERLTFDSETFDYLVLSHIVAVTASPKKLLDEAYRVLKPKGKLVILNHFTPNNFLKYFDYMAHFVAQFFHLKSIFSKKDLPLMNFVEEQELALGKLKYFKILVYRKS